MISRRTIRIKVLQILYAYYTSPDKSALNAEKELVRALSKTYDLYHYLLALPVALADYARRRIDTNRARHIPSYEDLHPNTAFVDNRIIHSLRENRKLHTYLKKSGLSWSNHPDLIRELYAFLSESRFFHDYIAQTDHSFQDDRKFAEKMFENIILISEDLYLVLEEESIYWNDDVDLVIVMILKTLKTITGEPGNPEDLLPQYKDSEDEYFAKNLFSQAILNHEELRKLIDLHSSNWDLERIAFMDILIMQLALTEFLHFPSIPTKVTLNEYIELSKYYSTDKSRNFINGILDKVLKELKTNQQVNKTGRGLIGETG